jgi:hypothetical protein
MRITFGVSLVVCLVAAVPATSATKRAVQPVALAAYRGTLLDAVTQAPVAGVELRSGSQMAISDASGDFTLQVPIGRPVLVTAHRTGYQDTTFTALVPFNSSGIPVSAPLPQPGGLIGLQPLPTVLVQLTFGQTVHLDSDSVQFAYVLPFETPQGTNNASFCKSDGTSWNPDRGEFAQITGPATSVTSSACCKLGPMLAVDVKMKNGDAAKVTFVDSCFGYDIDFVGRDHESAQYVYFNFKDIALITFP